MKSRFVTIALKYPLVAVSAFTTLMAVLVASVSLIRPEVARDSTLAVCAFIVVMGVLTWLHYWTESLRGRDWLLLWGGMILLITGAFGVAWAIHIGEVSGDYEYWVMMIDMALVAQGGLTILYLWHGRPALSPRSS